MTDTADLSLKQQHEWRFKLSGGYTAFVAALLIAVFAKSGDYPRSWIVISLLAGSLPSLVALTLLDRIVLVIQRRRNSAYRGLAFALGFIPSLIAVALLIGHFSKIAAIVFLSLIVFWSLAIDVTAFRGIDPKSEV